MQTSIRALEAGDFPDFFTYLNIQLRENGKNGSPLFQPVPRHIDSFPVEKETAFVTGLSKSVGQPGWRRAWIALNGNGDLMGHLDLRSHSESNTPHRALLGMGVSMQWRRKGVGKELVDFACEWGRKNARLEWIDIEVLSHNTPAIHLYEKAGFKVVCEIPDMFRIDGRSEGMIQMHKKLPTASL